MTLLSSASKLNRARYAGLILGRRQQVVAPVQQRHMHLFAFSPSIPQATRAPPSLSSLNTTVATWNNNNNNKNHNSNNNDNVSIRTFSVKNRERKEEKRRKRKEQKEQQQQREQQQQQQRPAAKKTETSAAANHNEGGEEEEEGVGSAAAPPVVTQTKASAPSSPSAPSAPPPMVQEEEKNSDGFIIAAAPPDEDEDEEFESRFSMPDREKEKQIGEMQNQVVTLYRSGHYQQGLQIAKETLQVTQDHFGALHPATASSELNVGLFHKELGNYTLALEHYEKALRAYEETVGVEHESYAMVLHNMGILYQSRLHFDEQLENFTDRLRMLEKALECLEAAYKIRSVELPTTHPHVVATQSALGMTLTSHILSQHKRVKSEDKKDDAAAENIAGTAGYRSMLPAQVTEKSWMAAEGHLRDALQKAVQNPRGESSLKRQDKNHYLNIQRKHNLKQKLKKKDFKIPDDIVFPTQTASAATASQNLAVFLKVRSTTVDTSDPNYATWVKEAQDLYQKALEVRTALLPKGHPDIFATQHSLAELLAYTGQEEEAEKLRQSILDTYLKDDDEQQQPIAKKKTAKGGRR